MAPAGNMKETLLSRRETEECTAKLEPTHKNGLEEKYTREAPDGQLLPSYTAKAGARKNDPFQTLTSSVDRTFKSST